MGRGSTNDFTVELPLQITTTKEQGCLVGQFSIPNVFSSVMERYNDRLYFRVDGVDTANTFQVNVNDRFYWGYSSPGQQTWLISTLAAGTYTAVQLAMAMANAIIAVLGPGTTVVQPPSGLPALNYNQGSTFRINSSNNRFYYRLNSPRVDNFVTLNSGDLSAEGVANAMRIALQAALGLGRSSVSARGDKVEFELFSITVTESNNKLYWLEGTPGLFARFVAIIPPGNYTFEGLLIRVRDRVTYARGGSTALVVTGEGGQLQFQYLTGFVLKIPTAAELANPTWKAANWDAAIVPVGEINPSSYTTPNSFNSLMTLPATPGNPVVGVLTYQTLQIPGTLDDWIGPPFDRSNPQAFNAYLTPVGYGTTLLTPWNLKNDFRIYIPGYGDVTDAQWRRDVWRGAAYDLNDSRSVGCISSPTPSFQATWSTAIDSPSAFVDYNICNLVAPGAYAGTTYAAQLQTCLNFQNATTGNTVTCTYQPDDGVIRVQSTRALVIFNPDLLNNPRWQADEWFAPKYRRLGTVMNPSDLRMANHIAYAGPALIS